ncbi:MAG: hypothetical protein ACJ8BW_08350 [Ktedonobacteraceae bacterium]
MRYRKKSEVIEATQWFQNGDHPQDESEPIENSGESPKLSEGKVVQPFRSLVELLDAGDLLEGDRFCSKCGNVMQKHGVLDGIDGEEYVCPSDYIVTDRNGLYYRLSRGEFESQYERYAPPPRDKSNIPTSDIEQRAQDRKSRHT